LHRIQISDVGDLDAFRAFLTDARVDVDAADGGVILARCPDARSAAHERNELAGYVATWNALNPGKTVVLE
jgi:hypothetical protein